MLAPGANNVLLIDTQLLQYIAPPLGDKKLDLLMVSGLVRKGAEQLILQLAHAQPAFVGQDVESATVGQAHKIFKQQ